MKVIFDRIFDRDNMFGHGQIHVLKHTCHRSGLTATGCTGDQDDTSFPFSNTQYLLRKAQGGNVRDLVFYMTKRHGDHVALPV